MIQLITKADLTSYTKVSPNIADLLINPAIQDAHTFDVLPLLSPVEQGNLVAYLALAAADRTKDPVHVLYTTAVRPLLCYQAYRRFLLDHGAHVTENGVETFSSGNNQPISQAQRSEMRADAAAKCSHFGAVLAGALRVYRGPAATTSCGAGRNRRPRTGGFQSSAV